MWFGLFKFNGLNKKETCHYKIWYVISITLPLRAVLSKQFIFKYDFVVGFNLCRAAANTDDEDNDDYPDDSRNNKTIKDLDTSDTDSVIVY